MKERHTHDRRCRHLFESGTPKPRGTVLTLSDGIFARAVADDALHLGLGSEVQDETERKLRHVQVVEQLWNRVRIQRRPALDLDDELLLDDQVCPVASNPLAQVEELER